MTTNLRPFSRPSSAPTNPDATVDTSEVLRALNGAGEGAAKKAVDAAVVVKHSRVACFVTPQQRWKLHQRAAMQCMSVNDYMLSKLFAEDD